MEEDIKNLEEIINLCEKEIDNNDNNLTAILDLEDLKSLRNLINRNKGLEEDNYVYHQLMKMQNEREYRSKFLKDFQKEYGKNVMPDYDEIYKRYNKQKKQLENSIPKSVIQEEIEELEALYDLLKADGKIPKYKILATKMEIDDLKEILKGDEK